MARLPPGFILSVLEADAVDTSCSSDFLGAECLVRLSAFHQPRSQLLQAGQIWEEENFMHTLYHALR